MADNCTSCGCPARSIAAKECKAEKCPLFYESLKGATIEYIGPGAPGGVLHTAVNPNGSDPSQPLQNPAVEMPAGVPYLTMFAQMQATGVTDPVSLILPPNETPDALWAEPERKTQIVPAGFYHVAGVDVASPAFLPFHRWNPFADWTRDEFVFACGFWSGSTGFMADIHFTYYRKLST